MADLPPPLRNLCYIADLNPTEIGVASRVTQRSLGSEIRKVRPVVVVSGDAMNRFLDTVVICPLTTTLHPRWRGPLRGTGRRDRR